MSYFSLNFLVKMVSCIFASVFFGIIFKINKRHLLYIGICATVMYATYYSIIYFNGTDFSAAFFSTAVAAIFAEFFARVRKAPAVIFILPSVISTVPGGSLYYTMRGFLSADYNEAIKHLLVSIRVGGGIAGGIVAVSIISTLIFDFIRKRRTKRAKRNLGN